MSRRVPRALALLGDPVEGSLSPAMHEAAFAAAGVDARYVALRTLEDELGPLVRAFARSGGGNVTVPHKIAARALLDRATRAVRVTGACNCFWAGDDGRLCGDNTDVQGFLHAVEAWEEGPSLAEASVLLLGAGGGARAVAAACVAAGAARLEVRNRTASRARELVERFEGAGTAVTAGPLVAPGGRAEGAPSRSYDLVVNATSLGLEEGDPLPLDPCGIEARAAFDLVYGEDGTRWTRRATAAGIPARDGLEMLVRQAGLSFRRWFGAPPPLDRMRSAASEGLAP